MIEKLKELYGCAVVWVKEKTAKVRTRLKGWKTILASAVAIAVGLADWFMILDIRPILSAFIGDEAQVGKIMAALGFIFAGLRFATTTGIFTRDED